MKFLEKRRYAEYIYIYLYVYIAIYTYIHIVAEDWLLPQVINETDELPRKQCYRKWKFLLFSGDLELKCQWEMRNFP